MSRVFMATPGNFYNEFKLLKAFCKNFDVSSTPKFKNKNLKRNSKTSAKIPKFKI